MERMIWSSQLYMAALYPNQEADSSRDQVLGQHIARLAAFVTPNHRDLKIPRRYQYECPWPAAQVTLASYSQSITTAVYSGGAETTRCLQDARGQGAVHHKSVKDHNEPPEPRPGQVSSRR